MEPAPDERNTTEAIVSHRKRWRVVGRGFAMTASTSGAAATSAALRARVPHAATQKPEVDG